MKKWFLILLAVGACSPKIVSYVNSKADFKNFETYRLVSAKLESKNVTPESTLLLDQIKENIHNQMSKRNYQKSSVSPDLTLRYEISSSTRVESSNQTSPYFSRNQFSSRTIYESVLLLELFDQKKKLVWQGSYDLKQERKEKKATRAIEKAVAYTFTSYPYNALSSQQDEALKIVVKKKKK
ncbi:DUF4136 domain-containing protein [Ekhidna sp.]